MHWTRGLSRATAAMVGSVLLAAATGLVASPRDAQASVSIAVGWSELLRGSSDAAVVSATGQRSTWEGGRIYTYTEVQVQRAMAGSMTTGSTAWIRTRGGVVGHIGQEVEGEAVLTGGPSLVFLHHGSSGAYEVTARAQGQFPVMGDLPSQPPYVVESHGRGAIVPRALPTPMLPPPLAADVLRGLSLDQAATQITGAWGAAHAN